MTFTLFLFFTFVNQADFIEPRIGYSDLVYNDTALNDMYENVSILDGVNLS